ncbi:MAG: helix-turn-helix transcriptional regulator [Miniphocaeibacter sp.]|uniref:helix-turn-helix domain-containing protein n=1 Tax=Miniphocaeibacter sp. TaxID=3100973 RepID=UPI00184440AB|nr:helix-turn-helix transcriptional regulator [Gallicola sp.]
MSETIGERIRYLRKKNNMTLKELSAVTGISHASLSKYENNKITNISSKNIESISKALNVSPELLMGWKKITQNEKLILTLTEMTKSKELRWQNLASSFVSLEEITNLKKSKGLEIINFYDVIKNRMIDAVEGSSKNTIEYLYGVLEKFNIDKSSLDIENSFFVHVKSTYYLLNFFSLNKETNLNLRLFIRQHEDTKIIDTYDTYLEITDDSDNYLIALYNSILDIYSNNPNRSTMTIIDSLIDELKELKEED